MEVTDPMTIWRQFGFILLFLGIPVAVHASEEQVDGKRVYGWVEKAIIMPLGATVKMKLDSGALTSSIHAKDVEISKSDDGDWVSFRLVLEDTGSGEKLFRRIDKPVHRYAIIRGAAGEERRAVVKMDICIGDTVYNEQFTLNDRSDMLYPVLIGRRTLEHMGLLDVTRTFITRPECDIPKAILNKVDTLTDK